MIKSFLFVAMGGALGASARYGLHVLINQWLSRPMLATLLANSVGCLLMGMAFQWIYQRYPNMDESLRLFITVGFLGALTTWSTFSMETVTLLMENQYAAAMTYFLLTSLLCLGAFFLGTKLL
ncbi:fluoride efflux transporter CrcB [Marinicella sp. W31]|uniref:fluoride efflux transporter CrcB n=1 Tax=Marinicella sp. W31 TaxID=3023713 RepID=UPI00375641DF